MRFSKSDGISFEKSPSEITLICFLNIFKDLIIWFDIKDVKATETTIIITIIDTIIMTDCLSSSFCLAEYSETIPSI